MNRFTITIAILLGLILNANIALAKAKTPVSYQIGEDWSRIFFKNFTNDRVLNHVLSATAKVEIPASLGIVPAQGSAFYVGQFNGEYLMMTNHHVISNFSQCRYPGPGRVRAKITFATGDHYDCARIVATFENIETTFFTINVPDSKKGLFQNLALKLDFKRTYKAGDKLLTAGYGTFDNPRAKLTYENSDTCELVSNTSEPHWLSFVNSKSKRTVQAWSFSHACEISPGDSGSPIVSRLTGKVIGLNWATETNKPMSLRDSATIQNMIQDQDPFMWRDLSYGVPNLSILPAIQVKNDPILNEFINSNLEDSLVDNLQ